MNIEDDKIIIILDKISNNEELSYNDYLTFGITLLKQRNIPSPDFCMDFNANKLIEKFKNDKEMLKLAIKGRHHKFAIKHNINGIVNESNTVVDLLMLVNIIKQVRKYEQELILGENSNFDLYPDEYLKNLSISYDTCAGRYQEKMYANYDAFITALFEIDTILSNVNSDDIKFFNQYMAYKLLYLYSSLDLKEISSPIENNIDIYNYDYIPRTNKRLYEYSKTKHVVMPGNFNNKEFYLKRLNLIKEDKIEADKTIKNLLLGNRLSVDTVNNIKSIYLNQVSTKQLVRTIVTGR